MSTRPEDVARAIKPYVLGWIAESGGGAGQYAPTPHDIGGAHHSGSLQDTQFPTALLRDGSRSLLGNLAVADGVTVDGVDISVLDGAVTAHIQATAVAGHSAVGAHNHQTTNNGGYLDHALALNNVTADQHHAGFIGLEDDAATTVNPSLTDRITIAGGDGIVTSGAYSTLTVAVDPGTGLAISSGKLVLDWDGTPTTVQPDASAASGESLYAARIDHTHAIVAAAPSTNLAVATTNTEGSGTSFARADHIHAITSSSNPGAAAALLASDASGRLQLVGLGIGAAPTAQEVRAAGPLVFVGAQVISTTQDSLTLAPAANVLLDPGGDVLTTATLATDHWSSGLHGTGWGLSYAGHMDVRSIYTEELRTHAFVSEIYSAMAGGLVLAKSRSKVSRDLDLPEPWGANIVTNGGFEEPEVPPPAIYGPFADWQTDNWLWPAPNGEWSRVTDGVYGGEACARMRVEASSSGFEFCSLLKQLSHLVVPGTRMLLSFYVRTTHPEYAGLVEAFDYNSETFLFAHPINYLDTGWQRHVEEFTIPAGCTSLMIWLSTHDFSGDSLGETPIVVDMFVDAVELLEAGAQVATLYVEDIEGQPGVPAFDADDYVLLRVVDRSGGGLVVENVYGQVTAYADEGGGEQSWTLTLTTQGYAGGDTIYSGSTILDYGSPGDGLWMATVLDQAGSPYSQVQTWSTVTDGEPASFTTHTRIGNLDGLAGVGQEYGLYAGQGLTDAQSYILITDQQVALHNLPLTIHDGTNTTIKLNHSTPYLAVGASAPTGYLASDGFWIGNVSGTYKLHIGDVDGEALAWDGSVIYLGKRTEEHIRADGATLTFYNNNTVRAQLSGDTWTLGNTGTEHVAITTTAVQIKDGTAVLSEFSSTVKMWDSGGTQRVQLNGDGSGWFVGASKLSWDTSGNISMTGSITLTNTITAASITDVAPFDGTTGSLSDAGALATADTLDGVPDGSSYKRVSSTIIAGGLIQVGSGTKDSTLNGWNINGSEIVGQLAGVDQVVLNTSGRITAGAGRVGLLAGGLRLIADETWGVTGLSTLAWGSSLTTATPYAALGCSRTTDPWESRRFRMQLAAVSGTAPSIELSADATASGGSIALTGTTSVAGTFRSTGKMYINDLTNAGMTLGLTINQGAADDEALALKSSDVAHGMTGYAETDTYGTFGKSDAALGGLSIVGYSESVRGLTLAGRAVSDDTGKTTSANAYIQLYAQKKSGTGVGAVGTNANLVAIAAFGTTRFIFDAEGDAHADVSWTTYDDFNDVALLTDLERAMLAQKDPVKAEFVDFLRYNHAALESAGLVHFDRERPGHAMVNTTKLAMVLVGAVRQMNDRLGALEQRALTTQ